MWTICESRSWLLSLLQRCERLSLSETDVDCVLAIVPVVVSTNLNKEPRQETYIPLYWLDDVTRQALEEPINSKDVALFSQDQVEQTVQVVARVKLQLDGPFILGTQLHANIRLQISP